MTSDPRRVDNVGFAVAGDLLDPALRGIWVVPVVNGSHQMAVQKRNDLASKCSVCVPEAISELRIAEQNIRDGKPNEALKWIAAALIHLDQLSRAFVEASKERAAEEGGHLVGDED